MFEQALHESVKKKMHTVRTISSNQNIIMYTLLESSPTPHIHQTRSHSIRNKIEERNKHVYRGADAAAMVPGRPIISHC